jgi:hypothetical protein
LSHYLILIEPISSHQAAIVKQYVDRYHCLRHRIPLGAHLRYLVESSQRPGRYLACLQFSSPAWMMAPSAGFSARLIKSRSAALRISLVKGIGFR